MRFLFLPLAVFAALSTGCPTGPQVVQEQDIDLSAAQRHEKKGRFLEAATEYSEVVAMLVETRREDTKAKLAWARIQGALVSMKIWMLARNVSPELKKGLEPLAPWLDDSGEALLIAGSAMNWTDVMSSGSADESVRAEGAKAVAVFLAEKIIRPELRRGRIDSEDPVGRLLYALNLRRCRVELEHYAASRKSDTQWHVTKTVEALEDLARALTSLAETPGVQPSVAAYWKDQAAATETRARALQKSTTGAELTPQVRLFVETKADRHLEMATEHSDRATREISIRGDARTILEAFEKSLMHIVYARECIVEPTPGQKLTLDTLSITVSAYLRQVRGNR